MSSEDEVEDDVEPDQWIPVTLKYTKDEDSQTKRDHEKLQGNRCELCEIADTSVEGVSEAVRDVFELEERQRRTMEERLLWKAIRDKYNKTVLPRAQHNPRFKRQNLKKLTCSMVRRHYVDGHNRNRERMLWDEIDYLKATLRQMRRGTMWQRNINSDKNVSVPEVKNTGLYLNVVTKIQQLIKQVEEIEVRRTKPVSSRTSKTRRVSAASLWGATMNR